MGPVASMGPNNVKHLRRLYPSPPLVASARAGRAVWPRGLYRMAICPAGPIFPAARPPEAIDVRRNGPCRKGARRRCVGKSGPILTCWKLGPFRGIIAYGGLRSNWVDRKGVGPIIGDAGKPGNLVRFRRIYRFVNQSRLGSATATRRVRGGAVRCGAGRRERGGVREDDQARRGLRRDRSPSGRAGGPSPRVLARLGQTRP